MINGVILFEGQSKLDNKPIVVIATGLTKASNNRKTGMMIQVWIIRSDIHPSEAVFSGEDYSICGNCIHRKHSNPNHKRSCYVPLNPVISVYRAYLRGSYPTFSPSKHLRYFTGRTIRWGAYGEPVLIPFATIEMINSVSNGWTGYTHQWKDFRYEQYQDFFQASCDNIFDFLEASSKGWSTFRALREHEVKDDNEITCQGAVKTTCEQCLLCNGSGDRQVHVTVPVHGSGAKNY